MGTETVWTVERVEELMKPIAVKLKVGGDKTVRINGRCGLTFHECCAIVQAVGHQGRDVDAYLKLFAASPEIIRFLLDENAELKKKVCEVLRTTI